MRDFYLLNLYLFVFHNTDIFYLPPLLTLLLSVIMNIYGDPHPDGVLKNVVRKTILHYRQVYTDKSDPTIFLSVTVNNSVHVYDDFVRFLFLHEHLESSVLAGELPEESDQFRFLLRHAVHLGTIRSQPQVTRGRPTPPVSSCVWSTLTSRCVYKRSYGHKSCVDQCVHVYTFMINTRP